MADIFISYAREDEAWASRLARALTEQGWSVFWDRTIPPGKTWREVIGAALDEAGCILVLWSRRSVTSTWVMEEADRALERKVLVPALIENVKPPLGYGAIQAADLSEWRGKPTDSAFARLVSAVDSLLGGSTAKPSGEHFADDAPTRSASTGEPERAFSHGGTQRREAAGTARFRHYALAAVLIALSGWVVAGPVIHHDMPGINVFIVCIVTIAVFIAFPVRPSASLLIVYGVHGVNLFALWTTMTPTRNVIEAWTIGLLIAIPFANAAAVAVFCRWRLGRRQEGAWPAPVPRAQAWVEHGSVGALLLMWSAFAATALASQYAFNLRYAGGGIGALGQVLSSLIVLWIIVATAGVYVGFVSRKPALPEGITFGWGLVPLCAAVFFYQTYAQIGRFNRFNNANSYYTVLIESTNWQAFTVLIATAVGLWAYASSLSPPPAPGVHSRND